MTVGSRAFQNARLQKKFKKDADAALAAAHQAYGNGRLADVETLCRRILQVLPDHFDTLHLLGVCLSGDPKRLEEAEQVLRAAIAVSPRAANVYCDLGTDPDRRLVVGYVSADFRRHSAGFVFMPVLRHCDHANFELVCYSTSPLQDEMTDEFRSFADRWVDAVLLSDEQLTDRIDKDGIDILVDLSGHSGGNRLGMFARKTAPIQVSAWGAPTGNGLKTMDYIFADPVAIPEGARPEFAEKIHDLPCMLTISEPAPVSYRPDFPMLRNGYVTFGTFNRIEKISNEVLPVWSRLLRELPGSKLVIKHNALDDAGLRDGLVARFVEQGVSPDSVVCLGASPREEHLAEYAHIDISLDPFPQNGGAGTWESLHMACLSSPSWARRRPGGRQAASSRQSASTTGLPRTMKPTLRLRSGLRRTRLGWPP